MAEGVGFEPTVPIGYNGFRDRPIRPLWHPSAGICLIVGWPPGARTLERFNAKRKHSNGAYLQGVGRLAEDTSTAPRRSAASCHYRRQDRLAGEVRIHIVTHQRNHVSYGFWRITARVGAHDEAFERDECIGHDGLAFDDVDTGAGDAFLAQRRGEGCTVDETAARRVDEEAGRTECVEDFSIDDVAGGRSTRGADRQHIAPCGQEL